MTAMAMTTDNERSRSQAKIAPSRGRRGVEGAEVESVICGSRFQVNACGAGGVRSRRGTNPPLASRAGIRAVRSRNKRAGRLRVNREKARPPAFPSPESPSSGAWERPPSWRLWEPRFLLPVSSWLPFRLPRQCSATPEDTSGEKDYNGESCGRAMKMRLQTRVYQIVPCRRMENLDRGYQRLFRADQADPEFFQLALGDGGRRFAHQIGPLGCLGEGDHFADRCFPRQDHHQPVQPQRDAAVRRRAVLQRLQQKSEAPLGFVLAESERRKDLRLNIAAVNPYRTRAQFDAVQHQIVGFRPARRWVFRELVDVLVENGGERMVRGVPAVLLRVPFEHRKIEHPQEMEIAWIEQPVAVVKLLRGEQA